eukprot:GHVP01027224.1.p1 GENE.GHVP01027224.1~~GHVP01027224.1.p1  ORF type:complete len:101 (-),score=3.84 GHVP01027224.1:624-926(-)
MDPSLYDFHNHQLSQHPTTSTPELYFQDTLALPLTHLLPTFPDRRHTLHLNYNHLANGSNNFYDSTRYLTFPNPKSATPYTPPLFQNLTTPTASLTTSVH